MPTTTWASGFDLVNLGPFTTTFTAPPECTLPIQGLGLAPFGVEPDIILWHQECTTVSIGSCLPSGSVMDDDYSSRAGQPNGGYPIYYHSPAAACPSNWTTVGVASRLADDSLSYSGVFDPSWANVKAASPTETVFNPLVNRWMNALGPEEAGIACCPSDYVPDPNAFCFSYFPAEDFPGTTACGIENTNWPPGTFIPGSFIHGNQTVTGMVMNITTTLDLISSETTVPAGYWATADGNDGGWIGIASQSMMLLATGGSAPTPTPTQAPTGAESADASETSSTESAAAAKFRGPSQCAWGLVMGLTALVYIGFGSGWQ